MGVAWDGGKIYQNGLLRGKQAMVIAAAGGPAEYYQVSGYHRASVNQILHPINHGTLAFCGMNVHESFVALDVLGLDEAGRTEALADLRFRLEHLVDSPTWLIRFN
jgi:putative NADPH-quinone reductase